MKTYRAEPATTERFDHAERDGRGLSRLVPIGRLTAALS
jgi:hypothetical protein